MRSGVYFLFRSQDTEAHGPQAAQGHTVDGLWTQVRGHGRARSLPGVPAQGGHFPLTVPRPSSSVPVAAQGSGVTPGRQQGCQHGQLQVGLQVGREGRPPRARQCHRLLGVQSLCWDAGPGPHSEEGSPSSSGVQGGGERPMSTQRRSECATPRGSAFPPKSPWGPDSERRRVTHLSELRSLGRPLLLRHHLCHSGVRAGRVYTRVASRPGMAWEHPLAGGPGQ